MMDSIIIMLLQVIFVILAILIGLLLIGLMWSVLDIFVFDNLSSDATVQAAKEAGVSKAEIERQVRDHKLAHPTRDGWAPLEFTGVTLDDIDAVAVFTPVPDHARHCQLVMNAGKHVISAVPQRLALLCNPIPLTANSMTSLKWKIAMNDSFLRYRCA